LHCPLAFKSANNAHIDSDQYYNNGNRTLYLRDISPIDSSPTGFHVVYALEHSYTTYSKNSVILITVDTAAVRRAL